MRASAEDLRGILAKAREKLAAAERELAAGFPGEASSHAYYAVFHAISAMLASRDLSFSSHDQTIGAFNREFVKTGVFPPTATRNIRRLFEDRQVADYDWASSIGLQTAADDVADAKTLVASCAEHIERHIQSGSPKQ